MRILKDTHIDFLRWRWHALALSLAVVVAGGATIWTRGISKGVEFAGGTVVIVQFDQAASDQQVRSALEPIYGRSLIINRYGDPGQRQVMIRVPEVGEEQGAALATSAERIEEALRQSNLGAFTRLGTEIVGPAVGRELTSRAIWATVFSLAGILAYIAFRFQLSFAVGAVVATAHDLAVTFSFLAFFG